ncbi:hypothetical protein QYE76_031724 [Lolium multiflorum]|uniref:Transposase (putative) gypsy type domain-containing protein n=1 Tax=Lolium multiflorum TaxID=4521 RepID=A0AAD8QTQ4_LOLMU|nr:hypothetical protein QYE76_031724 [Lolium multiflorum]
MAAQDLGTTEWERSKISAQDINLLKKLGLSKKKDALWFPSEESYPTPPIGYRVSFVDHLIRGLSAPIHDFLRGLLFVYGLQLHHLTPNSILHFSIFITLCECLLGVHPNLALWKHIFYLRRNGSHNIAYNIGGVVICVRPDVEYFDVKFPDSIQGWRKRWLYVCEKCADSLEHNIPPFDGSKKILCRRSWDAEATDEEKSATEALMTSTISKTPVGKSCRTRARRNLAGVRRHNSSSPSSIPSTSSPPPTTADLAVDSLFTCDPRHPSPELRHAADPLPRRRSKPSSPVDNDDGRPSDPLLIARSRTIQLHHLFLPFPKVEMSKNAPLLPTTPKVPSRPESEVVVSRKSAASSEKEAGSEASESTQSIPSAVSPKNKRKRGDAEGSGTSKMSSSPVEETAPEETEPFNAYDAALISFGDEEEEEPTANVTAPMRMSHTLALSDTHRTAEETSTPHPDLQRSTPATSPRASSPKRARIELGGEFNIAGGSATPPLDDAIFSEFDESKAKPPIFPRDTRSHKGKPGEAHGLHTIGRCGQEGGRAAIWGGPLGHPLAPPFRLYIPSIVKTLKNQVIFHEGFRSAAAIDDKFRGPSLYSGMPPGRGIAPGVISIDTTAIFIADSHDEEGVVLPEAEGSTGSYVVHLSPPWCDLYVIMSFVI